MTKCVQDIWVVARHELIDSVKSRRFIVILLLYIVGSVLACNACISVLHKLESQISETLKLDPASSPGAVTEAFMKSDSFRRMVVGLVRDKEIAIELIDKPPLALIYAGLVFLFMPLLIMLSTPARIANEISCGSAKFALFRTSRGAWCAGKFLGQALEIILPLTLSAVSAWILTRIRVPDMAGTAEIIAMLAYAWRVWIYCLAYIGLALGVSLFCRSANQAVAFALIVWTMLIVLYHAAKYFATEGWLRSLDVIPLLVPMGHRQDLWREDFSMVLSAVVYLLTLSMIYFCTGYLFFRKRNL
jgi:ABC-type transport system involved in multi-copper enzyme maturation permease subunit